MKRRITQPAEINENIRLLERKRRRRWAHPIVKAGILVLTFISSALVVPDRAQSQPPPSKPQQTPIDGGLGLLAAAGGAYAVKKLRDRRREI